jgi:nucleoside-diphosphate-sugar epimerase
MKQVLIFGGNTGVVAARVANELAAGGILQPVFADRHPSIPLAPAVKRVPVAITDARDVAAAVRNADAVISCVENNPLLITGSANALFTALRNVPDKRTVLLSSMAVYGNAEGVADERAQTTAVDKYSASRIYAETLASKVRNTICLRSGVEYGPGSLRWSGLIGKLLRSRRLGDLGAAGDGYCNLVYMDDLIQALINSLQLQDNGSQIFNICSNERVTWNDYFTRYARALRAVPVKRVGGRRLKIETKLSVPLKIAEMAIGNRWAERFHIPAPLTSSMLAAFAQRLVIKSDKAERVLGLKWTPLEEGLRNAAQWASADL